MDANLNLAEHCISQLKRCFHCGRPLAPGKWIPRAYEILDSVTVIALCTRCEVAIPAGSPAEEVLRSHIEQFQAPDDSTAVFHPPMTA